MPGRIETYDWSRTSLGDPAAWPSLLKTLVGLILNAEQPMFMAWGPDRVWFYNDAFIPILGQKHPHALGKHALDEVWVEAIADLKPLFDNVFAGTPVHMQDIGLNLDRGGKLEEAHFSFSYTPVSEGADIVALFGTCIEITDRVMASRRQSETTQRQQRLFEQAPGFIIAMRGSDHVVEFVNNSHLKLFGSAHWPGKPIRDAFPDIEGQGFYELLDQVYRTGVPFHYENTPVRYRGPGGREQVRYMTFIYAPVVDDDGHVGGVFCEGFDVSEARQLQEKLRELNETLEQRIAERTAELDAAQEALRQSQKLEAIGQLTGGIAHDFNNLLAAISGSLEFLSRRLSEGRLGGLERYIGMAQDASRRAAALTQRLLAFSRRQTLDPRPTDLNKLIAGMADLIGRSVGPTIEVEAVGAGGLWLTRVDASQLENALLNLCINGRDAMAPDGGRLTIETANKWLDERAARERELPPGQYVSLCVTDTGAGMTPEVQARAFDPFFTTKPLGDGTGLGLSMVYGFARQSGGQIRIYSEIGKGTTMCLYLPRFIGEAEDTQSEHAASAMEGDGGTVLVVDDEAPIRALIREVLEEGGYAVLEAGDGPAGLKILQSGAVIDLLITDVGLPGGMNGRQVADAARALRTDLKVLFITGYAENAAVGNGHLDSGMEIITKPFTMAALGNKVWAMLDATGAGGR